LTYLELEARVAVVAVVALVVLVVAKDVSPPVAASLSCL
jgi:hypothetical protein